MWEREADFLLNVFLSRRLDGSKVKGTEERCQMGIGGRLWGFPGGDSGKESTCQCRRHETWVWSLGWEDPLEQEMATPSMVSQRDGHYFSDLAGYGVV